MKWQCPTNQKSSLRRQKAKKYFLVLFFKRKYHIYIKDIKCHIASNKHGIPQQNGGSVDSKINNDT